MKARSFPLPAMRLALTFLAVFSTLLHAAPPNVVFLIADDLG